MGELFFNLLIDWMLPMAGLKALESDYLLHINLLNYWEGSWVESEFGVGSIFCFGLLSRELQINKSDSDLMYFPFIPHAVLRTMYYWR